MSKRLRKLRVHEVSLVDSPANQHARVVLAKRQDESSDDEESMLRKIARIIGFPTAGDPGTALEKNAMKCPDCGDTMKKKGDKMVCPECGKTSAISKNNDDDDSEEEVMGKQLEALEKRFTAKLDEALAKADERVKKAEETASAAQRELEAIKKASGELELIAVAKGMIGVTGTNATELAGVLKQLDEPGRTFVKGLLSKHDGLLKQSGLFTERGADGTRVEATTKLEKAADELQKADAKLSRPQAIAKALHNNPELYDEADPSPRR